MTTGPSASLVELHGFQLRCQVMLLCPESLCETRWGKASAAAAWGAEVVDVAAVVEA